MSLQSILVEIALLREHVRGVSKEAYHNTMQHYRNVARKQELKRDQHAVNSMLDATLHVIHSRDLTLAYMYKGRLYATHKSYRNNSVNGVMSSEYLIGLGLTMDEWDAMPKYNIWVHSGEIFSPVA
jgi:hypothetical protein